MPRGRTRQGRSSAGPRRAGWTCALAWLLAWLPGPGRAEKAEDAPAEAPAPQAATKPAPARPAPLSSLHALVDEVATAFEARAALEEVAGPFALELTGARGIDTKKVDREFGARLRRRLREAGRLVPVARAPLRARLVLSQEQGRVWAVGVLEGGPLPGPSPLAVSAPIDRELEVALGAVAPRGQRSWGIERLGAVPAGVLDIALVGDDDDGLDDRIAVLSVDGLRLYRYAPGDARPTLEVGPVALPGERPWPRVVTGWLARAPSGELWLSTSAGHSLAFSLENERLTERATPGVPLRQPRGPGEASEPLLLLSASLGSPLLALPPLSAKGGPVRAEGLPDGVRELLAWPGRDDTWLWVDTEGRLGGRLPGRRPVRLPVPERAGDRALLTDLNGGGDVELVTTSAAPPGESDFLTLYQVAPGLDSVRVLYRSPLSGGSIVALAEGELDFDGTPDLILVEEGEGDEAILWRLEYDP